jgi:hypothetical protein
MKIAFMLLIVTIIISFVFNKTKEYHNPFFKKYALIVDSVLIIIQYVLLMVMFFILFLSTTY